MEEVQALGYVPHPKDGSLLVNLDEMVQSLRDPLRLMPESNVENSRLAADYVEAYALRYAEVGR